ncbi:MAG: hypothetical protein ACRDFC_05180 [Ignavibacteria bacterium]
MKLTLETINLINELKEFSNSKIKNEFDLGFLIEQSKLSNKEKLFNETVFTAKYLNGLGKILHTKIQAGNGNRKLPDESSIDKIRNEYKSNMIKFTTNLDKLILEMNSKDKEDFKNKYLSMTQVSIRNLTGLIYDMSWLKKYMNTAKGRK